MKLLGAAPIGPEIFHQECGNSRTQGHCLCAVLGEAGALGHLEFAVNERINYLALVTEFPLVQDSLALMDEIIDNAILRAGGLPIVADAPHNVHPVPSPVISADWAFVFLGVLLEK